jgi:hypothetical protein
MLDIQIINCSRCGAPCKLATEATEEARLLRAATRSETSGYCVDCAATDFLQNQYPHLAKLIAGNPQGKQMLLDTRVQAQFARVMQAGNADARPDEINWGRVVDLWEMPFANRRARRTGGRS